MPTPAAICILVSRGPDAGTRMLVGTDARIVGRAREADLVLTDTAVSRRHLTVVAHEGGVAVRICEGASPFGVGDGLAESAHLNVGDQILLGKSVLSVTRLVESVPPGVNNDATDVRTVLSGTTADVRGLAAVFALVEALDQACDRATVVERLGEWARAHVDSSGATLRLASDQGDPASVTSKLSKERSEDVVVRAEAGGHAVTVPAHGFDAGWLTFRFDAAHSVTDSVRTLVVVAGRICASRLAQLDAMSSVERERDSLRDLAVGTSRAFMGTSAGAEQLSKLIPKLAASEVVVLLHGETGAGKTFVARLIHEASPRAREPLTVINCAAIPETLIESELFGHERGAFTGAVAARAGAFEAAARGTLLLDEIGELPLVSQAKLLRVLEEKRFERIGSNRSLTLQARVLAATNRDLEEMVSAGTFRRDLYFRVSVVNVRVPALRERGDDLISIAKQMLADLARSAGRRVDGFTPAALETIRRYAWPGNVRELRNAIERAIALGDGRMIETSDLPEVVLRTSVAVQPDDVFTLKLPASMAVIEKRAIEAALASTGGNRARAAALLGINRATLYNRMNRDDSAS